MSTGSHGRVKRVTAEFRGDEAVGIDILEVMLRMGEVSRSRVECDTRLVRLALQALDRAIVEYCAKTGQRYPGYQDIMKFLDARVPEAPADAARVVSIQK